MKGRGTTFEGIVDDIGPDINVKLLVIGDRHGEVGGSWGNEGCPDPTDVTSADIADDIDCSPNIASDSAEASWIGTSSGDVDVDKEGLQESSHSVRCLRVDKLGSRMRREILAEHVQYKLLPWKKKKNRW